MTRRLVNAICADHNDIQMLLGDSGTGSTLQATSPAPNSYTPPSGAMRWIRVEGGSGNSIGGVSSGTLNPYAADDPIPLVYISFAILLDATLASGESGRILNTFLDSGSVVTLNLEWAYVSSTTFNLRLTTGNPASGSARTIKVTGSTVFNTLEIIYGRIAIDGTNVVVHAQENDSDLSGLAVEMEYAESQAMRDDRSLGVKAFDDLDSGEYIYVDCIGMVAADSGADRPDAAWVVNRVDGDGEGSAQDYGDNVDCSVGSTSAIYTDVLLISDAVHTATYWCEDGGSNGTQEQTLAAFTPAGTLAGCTIHELAQPNVGAKTVQVFTRISDASGTYEHETANLHQGTQWVQITACSELTPSGGEWADLSDLNAIVLGVRSDDGNGANDNHSAEFIQAFCIGDDPLATGRSRVMIVG